MFLMEKEILYVQNPYQYLTRYFSDIPVDKEFKKKPTKDIQISEWRWYIYENWFILDATCIYSLPVVKKYLRSINLSKAYRMLKVMKWFLDIWILTNG